MTNLDHTAEPDTVSGRWVVPALAPRGRSTLTTAGTVLALVLVAGAAGYGLLTLATSVMWLPVTVVAGLLGAVLLCAASLALTATLFLAPLVLALGAARR